MKLLKWGFSLLLCTQAFGGVEDYLKTLPSRQPIHDTEFLELKGSVTGFLKESWCTPEKASLLMDLIVSEKPENCVEIGAFTGSTVLPVAAALKYLGKGKVYAIDAWSNSEAVKNFASNDPNRSWWATLDMEAIFLSFKRMVQNWGLESFCVALRSTSQNAIAQIPRIDFLHLDGSLSREGALEDATLYLPKVRLGGYILLSNLFWSVNNHHPKMDSFFYLLDYCDVVCEIDGGNSVLLKKVIDLK